MFRRNPTAPANPLANLLPKLLSLLLGLSATSALAQQPPYASPYQRSEFYAAPVFTAGKTTTSEGGTTIKTDTGLGLAFGYAYRFSDKATLGAELAWGSADYRAEVQPGAGNNNRAVSVNGRIDTFTLRMTGSYYFLDGSFHPFVTGGAGATYIDTGVPSGLPQNVCWYYPWWGQVCGAYTPTHTTTKFSYNVGAGISQDFNRAYFIRGMVNAQWVDFGGSYGGEYWTQYRVDFGVRF